MKIMEEKYITFKGKRIRYLQGGPETGKSLILLHGIGAASDIWEPFFPDCLNNYFTIALDFPGFGRSEVIEPLIVPDIFVEVVDFITQKLNVDSVLLIGHSMGGIVAAAYANRKPEKVAKLVLIDSGGFERIFPLYKTVSSKISENLLLPLLGNRWFGGIGFRLFYGSIIKSQTYLALTEYWSDPKMAHYFTQVVKGFGDWKVLDDLTRIKYPALIVWGQLDWLVPMKHAKIAQRKLPQAEVKVIKFAGHCPHTKKPREVNPILLEFLRSD
jgi:pimeloyl-ACP methyl ester carboxylesterase